MPDDRDTPKPGPPGPGGPGRLPGPDPKPDPLQETGDRFAELTRDLIEAVNTSGGFEPGGQNATLRPVLRATAENFAAGASAFSGITRMGIDGGHLKEEDLDLIAEIETWAAHFRMVTLAIQRALGEESRDFRRPPGRKPRDPDFFRDAGARFAELTDP